jgi:hypothetical protein
MRHRIDRVLFLCVLACPTLGVGILPPLAPSADASNSIFFAANGPTYAVRQGCLPSKGSRVSFSTQRLPRCLKASLMRSIAWPCWTSTR